MKFSFISIAFILLCVMACGPESEVRDEESPDPPVDTLVTKLSEFEQEVLAFQQEMNEGFADTAHSPLLAEDLETFEALEFFPIQEKFKVIADFERIVSEPFGMPTSTERRPIYEKYGEARFTLDGQTHTLTLFQSHKSREDSVWKNYLFLPFKDHTSGDDSYGGGRFLDVLMPENKKVVMDFNMAYNPYCAYNHKYSCPIPPEENYLEARIEAGVKAWDH